jgi:hypothetical protein
VPDTAGLPIAAIGVAYHGAQETIVYLDYLAWSGAPELTLTDPAAVPGTGGNGTMWRRAWVDAIDLWQKTWPEPFRLVQNEGRGLLMQGTREWTGYVAEATITPTLMSAGGIAIRVQGLRRFYALLLCADGHARLVRALNDDVVLGEAPFNLQAGRSYALRLEADGARLRAWIDNNLLFEVEDDSLAGGAAAFVLQEGHMVSHGMKISATTP